MSFESEPSARSAADGPPLNAAGIEVLHARNAQAAASYTAGRASAAAALFVEVLAECRDRLGAEHPATLTVEGNWGAALFSAGQYREGVAAMSANLAGRVRAWGEDDRRTLVARDALAVAYRLAGDVDDAVALSEQVTAQRLAVLGPTHLETLTSRMGLALAHAAAGDIGAAVSVLTTALRDCETTYGRRHPHTVALLDAGRRIGLIRGTP